MQSLFVTVCLKVPNSKYSISQSADMLFNSHKQLVHTHLFNVTVDIQKDRLRGT